MRDDVEPSSIIAAIAGEVDISDEGFRIM